MPAFFFDLDGTLFDTRVDLAATVNHTRRDLGLAELSLETAISFVGRGAGYLFQHAIPERQDDEVRALFRSHYSEHCCDRLPIPASSRHSRNFVVVVVPSASTRISRISRYA